MDWFRPVFPLVMILSPVVASLFIAPPGLKVFLVSLL